MSGGVRDRFHDRQNKKIRSRHGQTPYLFKINFCVRGIPQARAHRARRIYFALRGIGFDNVRFNCIENCYILPCGFPLFSTNFPKSSLPHSPIEYNPKSPTAHLPYHQAHRVISYGTECANFFVALSFALGSLPTLLYVYLHVTRSGNDPQLTTDEEYFAKADQFWSWTLFPVNVGTVGIAFFLGKVWL